MFRVLIADDEPIERLVVSKKIQKYFPEELEPVLAENGEEAVRLFREKQCRIAILDINMPGMDGLEAAEKIRKADSTCSIIFLTAYEEFSYAKKAIMVRALDYLLKPGAEEELIAVLEEAIRLAEESGADAAARTENPSEAFEEEKNYDNLRIQAITENIRAYIQNHYQEELSLQAAAGAMGYSDAYFCKIFKQYFGKNFTVYLTEFRMEMAKKLLADLTVNVKDVCQQVGFHDSNYFARVFKRNTGMTPSEYRVSLLGKSGKA
ncbi:MAG: response regulator [Eubacteriales bacterium]|nr:response regulator [Eubacteriales bacterium]